MARQCAQNFALQPGEATIARMVGASPVTVPVLERLRADGFSAGVACDEYVHQGRNLVAVGIVQ